MKENKWLAITSSRNDGDFIEAFIRGNSNYVDKFIIMDESTDNTKEILNRLRREGFEIEIIKLKGVVSGQKAKTNWMYRKFANPNNFSAVIPLDVDEIIIPKTPADTKENIRLESHASFLEWAPFAPASLGWPLATNNVLRKSFVLSTNELGLVKKIFVPKSCLIDKGVIELGAHDYRIDGKSGVSEVNTQLALAHFPIRSREQLVSKLAMKVAEVRLRTAKAPGESLHYRELVKMLIRTEFLPQLHDLQSAAANYANYVDQKSRATLEYETDLSDSFFLGALPSVDLRYNDLAKVNLAKNLYQLSSELTDKLVIEFGIKAKQDRKYRLPFITKN